jgi:2-isopropylmalate synthase
VECTINGIGERAGNCSLEEVVMGMRVRKDMFPGITTGIHSERLYPASRLVQSITGLPLQRNKAIVGENAFAHESGIHQHGVMKNPECYEIMTPKSVGVPDTNMVLGKHSGRAALGAQLTKLGMTLDDAALNQVFDAFKALADRKKEVYDGDLIALVESTVRGATISAWVLEYVHTSSSAGTNAGAGALATATVRLRKGDEVTTDAATGDGPVDAAVCAINRICGVEGTIEDFRLRSISRGGDALGEVSIRAKVGGATIGGKGLSTDIVHASALAWLDAVNRVSFQKKAAGEATQP